MTTPTTATDEHATTVLGDVAAEAGREAELEASTAAHLSAAPDERTRPRVLELIDGSTEDGIRLLRPFPPAQWLSR